MSETLPTKRTHERTPPADPAELLGYYETVIDESVRVAEDEQHRAWLALEEIHRLELWKAAYPSFAAYLDRRWGKTRTTAYRQIAWARQARELEAAVPESSLSTGVVPRVTTPVEPPSQRKVAVERRAPKGKAEAVPTRATVSTVPASKVSSVVPAAPEQLSLFSILDSLEASIEAAATELAKADRRTLARRLRALATAVEDGSPAIPSPSPDRKPCRCRTPTKSLTVSGLCTACHGWFR